MYRYLTRRAFAGACAVGIAGCTQLTGQDTPTPAPDNPAFGVAEQLGDLELTSPAFNDGHPIPEKYGRSGQDVNPPLEMAGIPDRAESLALIMDDPNAVEPAGKVWVHWLVWNVDPARTEIPEGWDPTDAVEGTNDFGESNYVGPDPPDGTHTYRFKLYALDTNLKLSAGETKRTLGRAMDGTIVARSQLEGTYSP